MKTRKWRDAVSRQGLINSSAVVGAHARKYKTPPTPEFLTSAKQKQKSIKCATLANSIGGWGKSPALPDLLSILSCSSSKSGGSGEREKEKS